MFLIWLAFYVVPCSVIIASWSKRSFLVISGIVITIIGLLWLDALRASLVDQGFVDFLADLVLKTASVSAMAGIAARWLTLAYGWSRLRVIGLTVITLAIAGPPTLVTSIIVHDRWQRLPPPPVECVARPSFDLRIGAESVSIPNWPIVMVDSGDEIFSLSLPSDLRRLCERLADGPPLTAHAVTFFFVSPRSSLDLTEWSERKCRAPGSGAAAFVCGKGPIEQLSIYADSDFEGRAQAYGRVSSPKAFAQQQAEGRYARSEALRSVTASVYPDGTWAFTDGSVFSCRPSSSGHLRCRGDFELTPGLLANVTFKAGNGAVDVAQMPVRNAVTELYAKIRNPAD